MARPKQTVPERPALGAVVLSIVRGNKRVMDIARDFGVQHSWIVEQLQIIEQEGWIKRNQKTKEYSVNYNKLINYYSKKFKISKKLLKENIKIWLAQIAATTEQITLDGIGTQLLFVAVIKQIAEGKMSFTEGEKFARSLIAKPEIAEIIKRSGYKMRKIK